MPDILSSPIKRSELEKFLPNFRLVKAFEDLSFDVSTNLPASTSSAQAAADAAQASANAAQIDADAAQASADAAQVDATDAQGRALAVALQIFGRPVHKSPRPDDYQAVIAARIFR